MTVYDNWWQFMTVYDSLWQLMTVDDSWWQLMTVDDRWWQLMTVDDSWWQLMTADDSWWQLMTADDSSSNTLKILWMLMPTLDYRCFFWIISLLSLKMNLFVRFSWRFLWFCSFSFWSLGIKVTDQNVTILRGEPRSIWQTCLNLNRRFTPCHKPSIPSSNLL